MSPSDFRAPERANLRLYWLRGLVIAVGVAAWFWTQSLIRTRPYTGVIGDGVLVFLSPVHDYLLIHVGVRNALLIVSSAIIDGLALFLFGFAVFGKSARPFVGVLCVFALRQTFQAICVLPAPAEMIWPTEGPGFPSLLVTYGVSNDLFFSGHTALAVYGATELGRLHRALIPVGILIALFEMVTVLALRAHWTMDVYAGAVTALLVALVVERIARPVDRGLGKITGA